MGKGSKLVTGKQTFGKRKGGSAKKTSGPKAKPVKQYRGQGR